MKRWILVSLMFALCEGALGDGLHPEGARISPTKVDFGIHNVGAQSEPSSLTLVNPGPGELRVSSILTSGIDFSQTNNCGQALQPGSECTIQVVFRAATIGVRIGQLSVVSSVPVQPQSVALEGTGQ